MLDHTSQSITQPFDFISRSRIGNEIGTDYQTHLSTFLELGHLSNDDLALFIASSMLMDSYPPRMHNKFRKIQALSSVSYSQWSGFKPVAVFRQLYLPHCLRAMSQLPAGDVDNLCKVIEHYLETLFSSLDFQLETVAQAHAENLAFLSPVLTLPKTYTPCLFCLRRKPEHVLTCDHAICDVCVKIFGCTVPGNETDYVLSKCILCAEKGYLVTRLKPLTAGVCILSIDGGGVVPLEFLRLMQETLGDELPVQDLFDQAFGTSSGMMAKILSEMRADEIKGGLIIIGLFPKHWNMAHCIFFPARVLWYTSYQGKKLHYAVPRLYTLLAQRRMLR